MLLFQRRLKWVLAAGLVVVAAGAAAQDKAPAVAPPPPTEAEVGFKHAASLTGEQQIAEAEGLIARMEAGASGLRKMLEESRQKRDVVKTLCLNDKLSQYDVAVRSSRERKVALQDAVHRGDKELSNHEFTILTVLKGRAEQLKGEANQCIGEEAAFLGATSVEMNVSSTIPPVEPEFPDTNTTIISGPPVSASPSM